MSGLRQLRFLPRILELHQTDLAKPDATIAERITRAKLDADWVGTSLQTGFPSCTLTP